MMAFLSTTGACRECDDIFLLTVDRTVRRHQRWDADAPRYAKPCPGSEKPPKP